MAQTNGNLHQAKKAKFDEFYTRFEDVVAELNGYWPDFEHRTVYCNCDDTGESAFWKYFQANFANMRLNRVIGTHYDRERPSYATRIGLGGERGRVAFRPAFRQPYRRGRGGH